MFNVWCGVHGTAGPSGNLKPISVINMIDGKLLIPIAAGKCWAKRTILNAVVLPTGKTRRWFDICLDGSLRLSTSYPDYIAHIKPYEVFKKNRPTTLGGNRVRPLMSLPMQPDTGNLYPQELAGTVPYTGTQMETFYSPGSPRRESAALPSYNPHSPGTTPVPMDVGPSMAELVKTETRVTAVKEQPMAMPQRMKLTTTTDVTPPVEPSHKAFIPDVALRNRFAHLSAWMDPEPTIAEDTASVAAYRATENTEKRVKLGHTINPPKLQPPKPYRGFATIQPGVMPPQVPTTGQDAKAYAKTIEEDRLDTEFSSMAIHEFNNQQKELNDSLLKKQLDRTTRDNNVYGIRTFGRITEGAKLLYGHEIAVETAFEDYKINNFCVIRDLIRRRAKKENVFVRVQDMIDIISIIIDEHMLLINMSTDWADDEIMLKRIQALSGLTRGELRQKNDSRMKSVLHSMRTKLSTTMQDLGVTSAPKVVIPSMVDKVK